MPTPTPHRPGILALHLAALGWHVFPLSHSSKRPLANCHDCKDTDGRPAHPIEACPCIPADGWCHGVRAATTDPGRIERWWTLVDHAAVGVATGPSNLVLIDIDNHGTDFPQNPAIGLLPGIDLTAEPLDPMLWQDPDRFRTGRDSLHLLAKLRGGPNPWPKGADHQPVTADTPSGGRHLWYRAPSANLRQANGKTGLAWQVDIKAGWSYGLAPGTPTKKGIYQHQGGDLTHPGQPPDWLTRELHRVAAIHPNPAPAALPIRTMPAASGAAGPAAYLDAVLDRGADEIRHLTDGRKTALSALAYKAGGYLAWSGKPEADVLDQLVSVGTSMGLTYATAHSAARRSLANGKTRPLTPRQNNRAA
jgi:hypothetical protein